MAAVIKIEVTTTGGIEQVKKDVQDLGKTAEQSGSGFNALKEIGVGALRELGAAALNLGVAAFQKVGQVIGDSISAAKESNLVAAQTTQVIKSTGAAAGVTAQHVLDYASALSAASGKSLFGDEQIAQSTNLLLTFTNIKGATLDAATAISVDMAQALGGAPKDAAIQLGKALNDPIKGITALTRVGVTFSAEQKAMIQAMTEAGDTAGAQKVILDELNKEFGGSAAAAAKADGGFAQFQDRLGEMEETIGKAILPILGQFMGILNDTLLPILENAANVFSGWLSGIMRAADPLQELINQLDVLSPAIGTIVAAIADLITSGGDLGVVADDIREGFGIDITPFISMLQSLSATFSDARNPVEGFLNVLSSISPMFELVRGIIEAVLPPIQSIVMSIFGAITTFIEAHGDEIRTFMQQTWAQIQTIIQLALQIIQATIVPALQAIASFISAHGTEIQALLTNTWNAIKAVIDIALSVIRGVLQAALQLIQGDWSGAWNTIQTMCARVVQDLITIIQSGVGNIVTLFGGLATDVINTLQGLASDAASVGSDIIHGIISGVENAAGALYDKLKGIASSALQAAKDALGISSPSQVFADQVGAPIMTGLILGIQSLIPGLNSTLDNVALGILEHVKKINEKVVDAANKVQDDLIAQAQGLSDKLSGIMADSLTGTASLDRAKAKAIAALKDISAAQQDAVQKQITEASTQAGAYGDPKQAAAFFKLRSDQIFELAKLRDQIDKTTDEAAKARLVEQFNLIGQAQKAELDAFSAKGGSSAIQSIADQIQKLLGNTNLPGMLDANGGTNALGSLAQALPQLIAMISGPQGGAASQVNTNQFTYAPNITTTAPVSPIHDRATAIALARV